MKILFDLDNCLCDCASSIHDYLWKEGLLPANFKPEDQVDYYLQSYCHDPDRSNEMFYKSEFWQSIPVIEEMRQVLGLFAQQNEIHICTDRRWYPELEEETREYLERNKIPFHVLKIIKSSAKADYARETGVWASVEDYGKTALALAEHCHSILVRRPWNKETPDHPFLYVADTPRKVGDLLLAAEDDYQEARYHWEHNGCIERERASLSGSPAALAIPLKEVVLV